MERDDENDYLALDTADDGPLSVPQGHSITYRIALGPQAGRKVLTLQTLPPVDIDEMHIGTVGQVAGFNLHAGVAARAAERQKLADVKSAEFQNSGTFCFSVKVFFSVKGCQTPAHKRLPCQCTHGLSGQVFDKPRGRKPRAVAMRPV